MKLKRVKKKKIVPKSRERFKRRDEGEMIKIVTEVKSGKMGQTAACLKYGLCRTSLTRWMERLSVRNLGDELSNQLLSEMTGDQKSNALEKKIKELTKALELARLKSESLETMIKVAEDDLNIKIRKKHGTKQLKE